MKVIVIEGDAGSCESDEHTPATRGELLRVLNAIQETAAGVARAHADAFASIEARLSAIDARVAEIHKRVVPRVPVSLVVTVGAPIEE